MPVDWRSPGLFTLGSMRDKKPLSLTDEGKGFFNKVDKPFGRSHYLFRKGVRRSIGTGKMVVEFFSVATSVKV